MIISFIIICFFLRSPQTDSSAREEPVQRPRRGGRHVPLVPRGVAGRGRRERLPPGRPRRPRHPQVGFSGSAPLGLLIVILCLGLLFGLLSADVTVCTVHIHTHCIHLKKSLYVCVRTYISSLLSKARAFPLFLLTLRTSWHSDTQSNDQAINSSNN